MNKILLLTFIFGTFNTVVAAESVANESEIVVCQDQADNFGNGKSDDIIAPECKEYFKKLALKTAVVESKETAKETAKNKKLKFYGYRNMILVEKTVDTIPVTMIIAGSSTELKTIVALSLDEKNNEVVALDESGEVLFFSAVLTGNIAPFRILKNKDLIGSTEVVVDTEKNQVIVNNIKDKKILFFSRMANINGREGKKQLEVLKSIDTSSIELSNLSIDSEKAELKGINGSKKQAVIFDLK